MNLSPLLFFVNGGVSNLLSHPDSVNGLRCLAFGPCGSLAPKKRKTPHPLLLEAPIKLEELWVILFCHFFGGAGMEGSLTPGLSGSREDVEVSKIKVPEISLLEEDKLKFRRYLKKISYKASFQS